MAQLADMFAPELTVYENLAYAACMRLPASMTRRAIFRRVNQIITVLGMSPLAAQVVGSRLGGGLSGGQRRKLALAIELLSLPSLLLLDEPTSGLDSTSSLDIMEAVRSYCLSGRTAIVTIHGPRHEIFHLFNRVLLLYRGSLVSALGPQPTLTLFGSLKKLARHKARVVRNPADMLLDCLTAEYSPRSPHQKVHGGRHPGPGVTLGEELIEMLRPLQAKLAASLLARLHQPTVGSFIGAASFSGAATTPAKRSASQRLRGWLAKRLRFVSLVCALQSRLLRQKNLAFLLEPTAFGLAFVAFLGSLFFGAVRMSALAGLVFSSQNGVASFGGVYAVSILFAGKGSRYDLEVASGTYKPLHHLVQSVLFCISGTLLPVSIVCSCNYALGLHPNGSWVPCLLFTATTLLEVWAYMAIAMLIAATCMLCGDKESTRATFCVTTLTGVLAIASGIFIRQEDSPALWAPLFAISPANYAFRAAVRIVLSDVEIDSGRCEPGNVECIYFAKGDAFLGAQGYADADCFACLLGLVTIWSVGTALTWVVLEMSSRGLGPSHVHLPFHRIQRVALGVASPSLPPSRSLPHVASPSSPSSPSLPQPSRSLPHPRHRKCRARVNSWADSVPGVWSRGMTNSQDVARAELSRASSPDASTGRMSGRVGSFGSSAGTSGDSFASEIKLASTPLKRNKSLGDSLSSLQTSKYASQITSEAISHALAAAFVHQPTLHQVPLGKPETHAPPHLV